MKCSILGSDSTLLCQVNSLREGFTELGHEHVANPLDPDTAFIFIGNAPFEQYLHLRGQKKLIFNVLDLCPHCENHDQIVERLKEQLPCADKVTTISETVARELRDKCGIRAEVIYYPSKKISNTGIRKYSGIKALCVGRVNDRNKRLGIAVQSLIRAGFDEHEVGIVGPENPFYGRYFGMVSDEVLNDIYNSTEYVMMMSLNEGIGLTAAEGAMAGAIPIVLPTLSTFDEFWAESPLGLHYQKLNSLNDVASLIRSLEDNPAWKSEVKQDLLQYAAQKFRPKFEAKAVAQRIFDIHLSL